MKTTSILMASSLLFAAAARAQTAPPAPRPFGTGELPEFLKPYDLDGDGKLSAEERQAFEKAVREARPKQPGRPNPWDADGDGKLSPEEIQAARDAVAAKVRETRIKRFNELDVDKNGQLSAAELKAIPGITDEMVTRMIGHLDKDISGTISLEEFIAVLKPVAPPVPPFPFPQPLPEPFPVSGFRVVSPLISFDLDKNGYLSQSEMAAIFASLDTDKDGRVSPDEWDSYRKTLLPPCPLPQPLPNPFPVTGIPVPPPLSAFDADRNFRLSQVEAQAVITALDTDKDGKVSPSEWDVYLKSRPAGTDG
jgi:Ca2+-binding EF-hand superfamily protein